MSSLHKPFHPSTCLSSSSSWLIFVLNPFSALPTFGGRQPYPYTLSITTCSPTPPRDAT